MIELKVIYNNANISAEINKNLLRYSFTDNASGCADDLQLTLEDTKSLWSGSWLPAKGSNLKAWLSDSSYTLPIGSFSVDEVEINGPPSTVSIKGVSVPTGSSIWDEYKTQVWEETQLSVIAHEIAVNSKLKLFYDTTYDPMYDRLDQNNETDISFLMRLCNNAGLCLKVSSGQVIVFDSSKYEAMPCIATIAKTGSNVISYNARSSTRGIYSAVRVEYEGTGEPIIYEYTPPNAPNTGRTLVINDRVTDLAEAEILAKNKLRIANMAESVFTLTKVLDIRLVAGVNVSLSGWGKFDGKYFVSSVNHTAGVSGHTTRLTLQKVMVGYK